MKNIINKIALLMLLAFTATACLDEPAVDFGQGPIITQFSNKEITNNFLQDGTGVVYDYDVAIEYQGADGYPLDEAVTITIAVDPSSTATEGVEFTLSETEFTIPAGSKTAYATIKVNSADLDALNPLKAVLAITSSSQTVSDKNLVAVTLQAICPSSLEGDYTFESARPEKVGITVTVTSTGPGTYTVSEDPYFGGSYSINISDVCGTITVIGGYLPDNFGIPVSGAGSVDETTGTISFLYTADGYLADRSIVLIKQ
tara:strand:- start:165 stop:938 length:774 start_codon:yes stop_codon:yes gene_type:complete